MPRLSVTIDPEASAIQTAFPETIAVSHVESMETTQSQAGAPMAVLSWRVDAGPYAGRVVNFHRVMLGGTTKAGGPMPMRQYCLLIEALKVPWAASPEADLTYRPFKRVKSDKGSMIFFDPDTNQPITHLETNVPEDYIGKQANVRYGVRKQEGSDREFNEVLSVDPLT